MDAKCVEKIKSILIKDEHMKLSKKFIEFVDSYVDEDFFHPHDEKRIVNKEEFKVALSNAYSIRSKYAHMLKPLMKQLTMEDFSKSGDIFEFQHNILFTYSGLLRVVRKVIYNFVFSLPTISYEKFDWRGALPGCVELEPAPYFWIWKMDNHKGEGASCRFEGLVECFIYYKTQIPRMDDLVNMYLEHLEEMKLENKLAAFSICCLYVCKIANVSQETKRIFENKINKYKVLFKECSIYGLVLLVMSLDIKLDIEWKSEECEKIVNRYCKKCYKSNNPKFPKLIEIMIFICLANSYCDDEARDKRIFWLQKAYDNANNVKEIQDKIKEYINSCNEIDISIFWDFINQKYKENE